MYKPHKSWQSFVLLQASDVEYPHGVLAQELLAVKEGGLEDHVAAQHRRGQHLAGRRRVDGLLPRVGGAGDHEAELEEPLCGKLHYGAQTVQR